MNLTPEEIKTLDKLVNLSNEKWFVIKTPSYIWDSDNKVKLKVESACKEFLQCTDSYINKLTKTEKKIINDLLLKING